MLTVVILGSAFALLFILAFFAKRRFGVLGLALCAGALLSAYWTDAVKAFLEQQGVTLDVPPLASVVAIALCLLPAVLLIFGGPVYHKKSQRFLGSLLFAVTAFLVTFSILTSIFVVDKNIMPTIEFITKYKNSILAGLIVYAVIDTMLAQGKGAGGKHSKEH